jgi:hypothetical protein
VRIRYGPAPTAILIALLAAGCGGGTDDTAKVKHTMTRFYSSLAAGDGSTACSLATASGRAKLERRARAPAGSCSRIVTFLATSLSQQVKEGLQTASIRKVTVHGRTATVHETDVTSTRGDLRAFLQSGSPATELTKQSDGSWRISG